MQKLLDFANLEEINYQSMEAYIKKHNIFFTVGGQEKGGERAVIIDKNKRRYYFSFDKMEFFNEEEKKLWYLPSTESEKILAEMLKAIRKKYRDFLDSCIGGKPDIDFINDLIAQFEAGDLKAVQVDNFKFAFDLQLTPQNFEQYIDAFEILYPIWRGEDETFAKIKKCKFCRKYFYAISLKSKFCELKCRNAFNYRKNK